MLKRLSLNSKLRLLAGIPLVAAMIFAILLIVQSTQTMINAKNIRVLLNLAVANSQLVHELQKERGLTAAYLGSNASASFAAKLASQRKLTDSKLTEKIAETKQLTSTLASMGVAHLESDSSQQLKALESIRRQVSNQSIATGKAISYYTQTNASLLGVVLSIVELAESSETKQQGLAYYNFIQAKERAGIERAVLSNIFAKNEMTLAEFTKFNQLVLLQNTYVKEFKNLAQQELIDQYQQARQIRAVEEVEQYRQLAQSQNLQGQFNAKPEAWFASATARINMLKQVENKIADYLIALSEKQATAATLADTMYVIAALLSMILCLALGYIISKGIRVRVGELVDTLVYSAKHNALDRQLTIKGKDEFSEIASALNQLLSTFSVAINNITHSSEHLADSSEQNKASIERATGALNHQKEKTYLVATAIEEMTQTINEVSNNTADAAQAAAQTEQITQESEQVVSDSVAQIKLVASNVDQVHTIVADLNESSSEITKVVDVIKSVAEQTNLLALNAAIEAARAGEQGRGFAVVADEVRTLAQRTQESTEQIETIINEFAQATNEAFNLIDNCQLNANNSAENAENIVLSIHRIQENIININQMTTQIATATEQQVAVASDISANVNQISVVADESAESAQHIAENSENQSLLAQDLQKLSGSFVVAS